MNDVTLKEHIEKIISLRFDSIKEYYAERFRIQEKETAKAYEAMEKRLEGMNEFRDTLKDQAATFITRSEFQGICDDIQELKETRAESTGKASQSALFYTLLTAVGGLIMGLVGILLALR